MIILAIFTALLTLMLANQIVGRVLFRKHPFDLRIFAADGRPREWIFFDVQPEFGDGGFGDPLGFGMYNLIALRRRPTIGEQICGRYYHLVCTWLAWTPVLQETERRQGRLR